MKIIVLECACGCGARTAGYLEDSALECPENIVIGILGGRRAVLVTDESVKLEACRNRTEST